MPPGTPGHRRKFGEGDKRRIVEKVVQPGASLSEVARRCGYRGVSLSGDSYDIPRFLTETVPSLT